MYRILDLTDTIDDIIACAKTKFELSQAMDIVNDEAERLGTSVTRRYRELIVQTCKNLMSAQQLQSA